MRSWIGPMCLAALLPFACDRGGCAKDSDCKGDRICQNGACVEAAGPAGAPTPVAAGTPATPAAGTPAVAPPAPADCAALAEHVFRVMSATAPPKSKAAMMPADKIRAECEAKPQDPGFTQCFMAATDMKGFDECNRKAFPGQVDATPKRSFDALKDNSAAQPPVLTQDGDYLAYDADCGMLYKEIPPSAGIFVACKGRVEIGPLVNVEEIEAVNKALAAQETQRHEAVKSLVSKAASGDFRVPTHVYNANGSYRGVEYH